MLRPNLQRSKNTVLMIWIVLGLYIFTTLLSVLDELYYDDIPEYALDEQGILFYELMGLFAILYMAAYITSVVTFIRWFRRAYYNLHLKIESLSYPEGWAAGGWFIPIANIFVPYKIMKELFSKTNSLLSQPENSGISYPRLKICYVRWWWAFWLITGVFESWSFRTYIKGDIYGVSTGLEVMACLLMVPLSFITVKIIKDYSVAESALADAFNQIETDPR